MNRQQLLSRLAARGWPVTYSTGPLTVWDRTGPRWPLASWWNRELVLDGVRVVRAGRAFASWPRFPAQVRWSDAQFTRRLRRVFARQPAADSLVLYLFHPGFLRYHTLLRPRYLVYHAYDCFAKTPGWTPELAQQEAELIRRADLVIGSSAGIVRHFPGDGPARGRVLYNGADPAAFLAGAKGPPPADLAALPRPRIGYVGRISRKVDLALIDRLAGRRPDWHWVLVGPLIEDDTSAPELRRCRGRPNVHFLGERNYRELPGYAGHMDVNTIPYRQEPGWWQECHPLKLHEYLAGGKPVVASAVGIEFPEPPVLGIAGNDDAWIAALDRALSAGGPGDPASRRRVAFANSWDARVTELEGWLRPMLSQVARPG
jgi:glycosyltransferase involved in cell wall biosynthesis